MARVFVLHGDSLSSLVTALRTGGFDVHEAVGSATGLDACRGFEPDAVIVDFDMCGMDRRPFVEAVEALPKQPLVILVTAHEDSVRSCVDRHPGAISVNLDEFALIRRARHAPSSALQDRYCIIVPYPLAHERFVLELQGILNC
ncbi:MAG: response regulator [Patescibacteria group bacterium]|nr:response regulator [Patescibacteria group bacterium]MDD5716082.1 response regulator [Patescibacteria group bacterium]